MLIIYTPASMLSLAALYHFYYVTATPPSHVLLIAIINFIHYAKRIFASTSCLHDQGCLLNADMIGGFICASIFWSRHYR